LAVVRKQLTFNPPRANNPAQVVNQIGYSQVDPKRAFAREAVRPYGHAAPWRVVIMSRMEGKQEEMT
jgi:hypothetical protein